MKLNNKILISLLGGLVIFYIVSSLFRGTYSLDEVPANPAFDDINFYKCCGLGGAGSNGQELELLCGSTICC